MSHAGWSGGQFATSSRGEFVSSSAAWKATTAPPPLPPAAAATTHPQQPLPTTLPHAGGSGGEEGGGGHALAGGEIGGRDVEEEERKLRGRVRLRPEHLPSVLALAELLAYSAAPAAHLSGARLEEAAGLYAAAETLAARGTNASPQVATIKGCSESATLKGSEFALLHVLCAHANFLFASGRHADVYKYLLPPL